MSVSDHTPTKKDIIMTLFDKIDVPIGKIAFAGTVRTALGYGANEFQIEFPERQPIFGEWEPVYEENGNDYNIRIVSFGYTHPDNVGNSHPLARINFSEDEKRAAQELIIILFNDERFCDSVFPIARQRSRFLGNIVFVEEWINIEAT